MVQTCEARQINIMSQCKKDDLGCNRAAVRWGINYLPQTGVGCMVSARTHIYVTCVPNNGQITSHGPIQFDFE